jgi:hypothetical protein
VRWVSKKGITIEGVPLDEHLKNLEEKEESKTMLGHMNGVIFHHRRNIPSYTRAGQHRDITITSKGSPRVSKRVRYLSQEEIEKEYGMPKTEPKPLELLRLWKKRGRLTSVEAAEHTEYARSTAGTLLWRFSAMWPGHVEIDRTQKPVIYIMGSYLRRKEVHELYQDYLEYMRQEYHKRKDKRTPKPTPPPPDDKETVEVDFKVDDEMFMAIAQAAAGLVRKEMHDYVASSEALSAELSTARVIDLNVNVTFSFKLGG